MIYRVIVRRLRSAVVVALSVLMVGCSSSVNWAPPMLAGLGGVAIGWVGNKAVQGRGKCGDLQRMSVGSLGVGVNTEEARRKIAFTLKISEEALAKEITAADINFWNVVSVVCALRREHPDFTEGTKWLEIASKPRIMLEILGGGTTDALSTAPILWELGISRAQIQGVYDEVSKHTTGDAPTAWKQYRAHQQALADQTVAQVRTILTALEAVRSGSETAAASMFGLTERIGSLEREVADIRSGPLGTIQTVTEETKKQSADLAIGLQSALSASESLRNRPELEVKAETDLYFAFDSAIVPDSAFVRLVGWLAKYRGTRHAFSLIGSADGVGDADYNVELSQRRANAVGRILLNAGIPPTRITVAGAGAEKGDTKRRRVRILVHAAPALRSPE